MSASAKEPVCEKRRGPPTPWNGLEIPKPKYLTLPPTFPRQKYPELKITNRSVTHNRVHLRKK